MAENVDERVYIPLTDVQMKKFNRDAHIMLYPELNKIKRVEDIFKKSNKVILFFEVANKYNGHWTALIFRPELKQIEFFDSYGFHKVGDEFDYIPQATKLNENRKILVQLLYGSKYKILLNPYKLQKFLYDGKPTETCGRHVTLRLNNSDMKMSDFVHKFYFSALPTPSDVRVCELIN